MLPSITRHDTSRLEDSSGKLLGNYGAASAGNFSADNEPQRPVDAGAGRLSDGAYTQGSQQLVSRQNAEQTSFPEFRSSSAGRPPAGWRQAGIAELSSLGLRAEDLSNLSGRQFARVFVPNAKGDTRVVVQIEKQAGHWQAWLNSGSLKYGPSAAESKQIHSLVQNIGQNTDAKVTVVQSNISSTAQDQNNKLSWINAPLHMLPYLQSLGRQAYSI